MNEATKKALTEQKDKLLLAESADEIKDIVTKAGGEIAAEDAEKILAEIRRDNAASGTDIDDDEMDAVAGGWSFPWIDGTATDGEDIGCWWTYHVSMNSASYSLGICQYCKVSLTVISENQKQCPQCNRVF